MKFEATDLNVLYLKYIQLNQNRIQTLVMIQLLKTVILRLTRSEYDLMW